MKDIQDDPLPALTTREITPEQARRKRAQLLAAQEAAAASEPEGPDRDPADASLATLILPGG